MPKGTKAVGLLENAYDVITNGCANKGFCCL